jgi:hypothetical protein
MAVAMRRLVLAALIGCVTAGGSLAQETTTSTETKSFTIIAADGNMLVVKLPEGTREMIVPDDFRFTVNGQSLSVAQLTPGMSGTATITTRTTVTPVTVTEVRNGTILRRTGTSITVRTDQGIKAFTQEDVDKRGVTIMRDGRPAQLSDFREGDLLTATVITTKPPQVLTERQVQATVPPPAATSGIAPAAPPPASPPPASAPAELPKTASSWPLLALASALSLVMGLGLTIRRRLAL